MKSPTPPSAEADARVLAAAAQIRNDPERLAAARMLLSENCASRPAVPRLRTGITNRAAKRAPVKRFKKPANRR